ncbi:MAG: RnfABCDGE type electron transport complex subunit A [Caldisericaceae bacterium]|nr:RnfABCDGE type electron transport complex subunit A [Caldisericaceae bacterium]RLD20465.1 MAG: electron transport complex subunit RsxA [Caldisericota bacterium]
MSYLANLGKIFVASAFVNNIVLLQFLGLCSYIGLTDNMHASIGMGYAVTFVTVLAAAVTWIIDRWILIPFHLQPFLQIVSFILVIGSLVGLVEIYIRKMSPHLYKAMGIYLPLIATNCLILGVTFINSLQGFDFVESIVEAVGAAIGYFMAMLILAGIRERLRNSELPDFFKGKAIAYMVSGIVALAFMGFQGMIK